MNRFNTTTGAGVLSGDISIMVRDYSGDTGACCTLPGCPAAADMAHVCCLGNGAALCVVVSLDQQPMYYNPDAAPGQSCWQDTPVETASYIDGLQGDYHDKGLWLEHAQDGIGRPNYGYCMSAWYLGMCGVTDSCCEVPGGAL